MIASIIIILGVVLADQITKILAATYLDPNQPTVLIKGVFRFTYVENRGAAFGMLDDARWVFMVLSTVAIVAICYYLFRYRPQNKMLMVSLSLVAGGGIGNMIDRVRLGYVIDFFDFYAFPKIWIWVFNVADACVCVAAGMLIIYLFLDLLKEKKQAAQNENQL